MIILDISLLDMEHPVTDKQKGFHVQLKPLIRSYEVHQGFHHQLVSKEREILCDEIHESGKLVNLRMYFILVIITIHFSAAAK